MILVIDNYDSFTYNLVQLLWVAKVEVVVLRNDVESAEAMLARAPVGILISPGPGRPEEAGVCMDFIVALNEREVPLPVLGVCLGQQVLGRVYGATVDRAPQLMHGKTSQVRHNEVGIFKGLPNPFEATRYHSLEVQEDTLPPEIEALAWSEEGTLMGLRHRRKPYWGVQFHPESILTVCGPQLIANFLALCEAQ